MATGGSFLSENQFLCSICLEVFTEPVSIPCGHNFCKACINRHWEDKQWCQCPLCNERFNRGFKPRVNTGFREVVENFKKHHARADNNSLAKPGQVPCDCCLTNKLKACKTCLVCLTSYCETHLEPHLRVAALKRHKLTDPVYNLEDQICKKHNRMFEFCRNDQTYGCVLCKEHSSHDMVPLEEAFVDKKAQMGKKKAEVQESKHRRGKKGQKTKEAVQTKRKGKDKAMSNCVVPNQMEASLNWWIPNLLDSRDVPGNMDVSEGRFYHEVQAEGFTSRDLGVVREPMRGTRTFIPEPRNGNWVIRLGTDANCKARRNIPAHVFWIKEPKRVKVLVDFDNGLVYVYDNDTGILGHIYTCCNFIDMVYLFYCPSPDSWTHRLQKKVQKIKAQLPDTEVVFCCIVFFFVLVGFICIVLTKYFF
ncbi:hypothetical protein VZT92_027044 [Zoarces viviparus]|uniref:RING-type domain-containing protein n=1 Tax=Zoarces viviparus TaxID=48416 RepID=A0AAW1DTM9_ZOAVI